LLGPGSGKRYIIEDHDIRSCSFTETPPEFNRIDVVGDAPLGIGSTLQRQFEDRYFWAGATDFDSWRQFGYLHGGTKNIPYASDPELQCRPFAIMELQLQRTKINRAEVSLNGNEYYEPGDVVFIKDQGLLYYVTSVSHSFSFGGSFETKLLLENGHPPGNYLPSPIDIIGQELAKNFLDDSVPLVYRNQNGDDSYRALQPDSNLLFPAGLEVTPDSNLDTLLDYRNNQVRYTNMMIDLNTITVGNRMILLRGFVRNETDVPDVVKRLAATRYLLENPTQITQTNTGFGDDLFDTNIDLNLNIGSSKELNSMILPNGLEAKPVPSNRIIEQIVYLNGSDTTAEILCLNSQLLSGVNLEENIKAQIEDLGISPNDYASVFPKGGPKQSSWLDLRDDITNIKRIIEVGVLDVQAAIGTASEKSGVNTDLG